MIALDTNLLVRRATDDVPAERRAVVSLLERHETLIPKTVLLETEWVLRSRYGYAPGQIAEFFEYLSALASMTFEDEEAVCWAVSAIRRGIDFADALHLASGGGLPLATLDQLLHRKASRMKDARVQLVKVSGT